jgi:type VI secretion system secreted protein VgrG
MSYTSTSDPLLAAAESVYEQAVWQILLNGKAIQRLSSFQLNQAVGAHHQFELVVYHTELQEAGSYRIEESRHLLGKTLTAMMGSPVQPDRVSFSGIITAVAFRESQGLNGEIILSGYSPTILLESGPHLHSFYN